MRMPPAVRPLFCDLRRGHWALLAGCSSDGERQRDMRTAWHHFVPFTGAAPVSPGYRALEAAGTPVLMLRETGSGRTQALRRVPGQGRGRGVVSWRAPAGSEYDFLNGVLVATPGPAGGPGLAPTSPRCWRGLTAGRGAGPDRFESRLDGDGQVVIAAYVCDVTITAARGARKAAPARGTDSSIPMPPARGLLWRARCSGSPSGTGATFSIARGRVRWGAASPVLTPGATERNDFRGEKPS